MFSLTIEDNNGQIAEEFSFDHGSYLVGRQENCDIVLPSNSVSRKHAKIFVENGRCYIEDLNSANGVNVDGQRVNDQRDLGTASQIKIGDYYLYLEYKGEEALSEREGRDTLFIDEGADHNKIVRVNDEFAGEEFSLSEVQNTIGRTDDNFILLSDPSISREHAMITREGDRYVLADRGSSNGTRVNGREIAGPHELRPGDVVEFGNVQFVFARGNQNVDLSKYASSEFGTGAMVLASAVVAILLVALVAGLLVVFGFWSYGGGTEARSQPTSAPAATPERADVESLVDEGSEHLSNERWHKAIETFNEVLARAPDHERAKQLREEARRERRAEQRLDDALEHSENDRHEKALEALREIPEESAVYDEARSTLERVRKSLARELRAEAKDDLASGSHTNIQDAHETLKRAASLAPDGSKMERDMEKILQKLEAKMKDEDIPFEPYE